MIIKVCYGSKTNETHTRIIECVDIHLEKKVEDGRSFVEAIVHSEKSKEDTQPCVLHLGKRYKDILYLMKEGKTVDKMVFYPEPQGCSCGKGEQCSDKDCKGVPKANSEFPDPARIPNLVLLSELFRRSAHCDAPKQTTYNTPHTEVLLDTGDSDASIRISNDALVKLAEEVKWPIHVKTLKTPCGKCNYFKRDRLPNHCPKFNLKEDSDSDVCENFVYRCGCGWGEECKGACVYCK